MKKESDLTIIFSTAACLLPMALSALVYDRLPAQVPIHFNASGTADNYAPRAIAAYCIPALLAVINIFVHFLLNNDPKKINQPYSIRLITKWLVPVGSLIFMPATLFIAMGMDVPINLIASSVVGLIFIALGNYLPKSKQNYTIGLKLPWTLSSETNWNKTHHLAGYLWIIGGIVMVIGGFLSQRILPVTIAIAMVLALVPAFYSYSIYKNEEK